MIHNEDSRVKIPVILHLVRLGYQYLSLKQANWDLDTNIFPDLFHQAVGRINPEMDEADISRLLDDVKLSLENEDLGKVFYDMLVSRSGARLIDFQNFDNNSFHVVTELTCKNGDDEFRPDITLLINGMPLVFIEVKKPNNRDGVIAERDRINTRSQNPKFRNFINTTQLMMFSNNMEYVDGSTLPIEGAFYASSSYNKPIFNYFREEENLKLDELLQPVDDDIENAILKDNNLESIKSSLEFILNKQPDRPTNRICTSLLSRERLSFMLQYALAYVKEKHGGWQKHVMRYPQLFATKAIEQKLDEGVKKGIIWHTQGSGKTALTYYNVKFLTDYFQKKNIVPKFYFIVDRLDLLTQAQREFTSRGLIVHLINSREDFTKDIKATKAIHNDSGKAEITVVNIQKFKDDPDVVQANDYNISIQRVYFLDEVHRSYNPKGSFLANLDQSDRDAIKIGLTGTPLLLNEQKANAEKKTKEFSSKQLFGNYIHKYYYNASIADGYTLRLIREEIQSNYRLAIQKALNEIKVQQGDLNKKEVYAHQNYVLPMLEYILTDFEKSRGALNDDSIGGMVICDSSEQAKKMYEIFQEGINGNTVTDYSIETVEEDLTLAAEARGSYSKTQKEKRKVKSAALILHDIGTKDERKEWVEEFKQGNIDFLFVYNMLLTGFDAPRLKKLYLGRVIKKHNLLQALTRVNRTYKEFRYGYIVDFADISKEFDETNKAYFDELQSELGDEFEHYSNLFKSTEEIKQEMEEIKDILFLYDTENAEVFSDQISEIDDKQAILKLKKALENAKELYNLIRLQGSYELLDHLNFQKLNQLYKEANDRLVLLNQRDALEQGSDNTNLLNIALEDIIFQFKKVSEEELVLADKLKNILGKTREVLGGNIDPQDPKFISLKEELERLFKKKKLSEITQKEMDENIQALNEIHKKATELNVANQFLQQKYSGDAKYTRIHKRLTENGILTASDRKFFEALMGVKEDADETVLNNAQLLSNEPFFQKKMQPSIINRFMKQNQIKLTPESTRMINQLVVSEYMNEYNTGAPQW